MKTKKETTINELSVTVNELVGTVDKLAEITHRGFEELKGEMKNDLRNEIGGLREELKNEMSEKFDRVLTGQDRISKRLEDLETENVMDAAVHRRQDDKLENHEERIVIMEERVLV